MNNCVDGVGERFSLERKRLGLGVQEAATVCGVTRNAIHKIERGTIPSGAVLGAFAEAGADAAFVLIGKRASNIDLQLLGVCEAALRLAYEQKFPGAIAGGAFRSRIVATVYNQVVANANPRGNQNSEAVAAAAVLLDSLHDPADPGLLLRNLFSIIPASEAAAGVTVQGDGNRVAGRDMIGGKGKR